MMINHYKLYVFFSRLKEENVKLSSEQRYMFHDIYQTFESMSMSYLYNHSNQFQPISQK